MATYIVKADIQACNGAACRLCENYLPGFFEKEGGVQVVEENAAIDGAEMAEQFCPQQCITVESYKGDVQ